jgi:hypothetical protein
MQLLNSLAEFTGVLPSLGAASMAALVLLLEVLLQTLLPGRPEKHSRIILYTTIIIGAFVIYFLTSTDTIVALTTLYPSTILYSLGFALCLQLIGLFLYVRKSQDCETKDSFLSLSLDRSAALATARKEHERAVTEKRDLTANEQRLFDESMLQCASIEAALEREQKLGSEYGSSGSRSEKFRATAYTQGGLFALSVLLLVFSLSSWADFDSRVVFEFESYKNLSSTQVSLRFIKSNVEDTTNNYLYLPNWNIVREKYLIVERPKLGALPTSETEYQENSLANLAVAYQDGIQEDNQVGAYVLVVSDRKKADSVRYFQSKDFGRHIRLRNLRWILVNGEGSAEAKGAA